MSKKIVSGIIWVLVIIGALAFIFWKLGNNKKENTARTDVVKDPL
jgi:flagellar biogenesis protein FliO